MFSYHFLYLSLTLSYFVVCSKQIIVRLCFVSVFLSLSLFISPSKLKSVCLTNASPNTKTEEINENRNKLQNGRNKLFCQPFSNVIDRLYVL